MGVRRGASFVNSESKLDVSVAEVWISSAQLARKRCTYDRGEEGTGHTLVHDVVPISVLEKGVRLDLDSVRLARAESTQRIASEELLWSAWYGRDGTRRTLVRMETESLGMWIG